MEQQQLTIDEALSQGYEKYLFSTDGFQGLRDIKGMDMEDLKRRDICLVEKEPYSPAGISSKDIALLLADDLEANHVDESGDDTGQVYDLIKELDFSDAEKKIADALSTLSYYKGTNIKLVANPTAIAHPSTQIG
jgi:hypothetical protein